MEEEEEGAGLRKRKRHGDVRGGGEDEAGADGDGRGWCEKEMGEGEQEQEEYEGIAEESVEEVMRWLEAEISAKAPPTEEDGFVTINGNEESCGPSFSAAASTVMASVDTRAGAPSASTPAVSWPWPWPPAPGTEAAREEEEEEAAAAADVACELDEEWLEELLTAGPALEV